ncbi:hypothetical protein PTKIN_Ptkin02bG0247300 [Pterospermum kingtungense]
MTASDTVGGDDGMASSPRNKMKFLCSYGGKILPRPGDANLKYVGGETRVVAVPRDIKFSELMKKLNDMVEGDMVLKYQVIPDELDALVTVKSDEDLKHMVDENSRLESEGTAKLRVFLFPSSPVVVEHQMNYPVDPFAIEQRYIEAVNGITRRPSSTTTSGRLTPVNVNRPIFSISACSSPASPDDAKAIDSLPLEPPLLNRGNLPKVQSSPSLNSLNTPHLQTNHQVYQPHYLNYHQSHQQLQQPYSFQSPKPPLEFRPEKSPGPHDHGKVPMGHGHVPVSHVYSTGKHNLGNGYIRCGCCYDECLVHPSGGLIRRSSVSTSSGRLDKPGSPRHNMWD